MEHLSAEGMARLVDETPSEAERAHLAGCPECAAEVAALREQSVGLGELPALRPPTGDWEVLQARLMSEGLVRGGSRLESMTLATTPPWMRIAAAAIVFVAGGAVGGAVAVRGGAGAAAGVGRGSFPLLEASTATSAGEAEERLRLAERQYMDALVQYRQLADDDESVGTPDAESRFAALEYMVRAGKTALQAAPADPFLNGLVASAVAEREMVLRRISPQQGKDWY